MTALYNEIDKDAAHVLRCLIADGLIAPGDVDDRSIKEIQPDDLAGYTQVHLFAGAGLWSVAARLGGWADERPLWSASCPCQPFSAAGKGLGVDDPRHLWPDVDRLIRGARERGFGPPVLVGEQVAGAPGYNWFNGVRADLAQQGYRARVVDIPACSVDAPHIRQRLYWCAMGNASSRSGAGAWQPEASGRASWGWEYRGPDAGGIWASGVDLVDASRIGRGEGRTEPELWGRRPAASIADASGVTLGNAFGSAWAGAEWLLCHDGKARRTESGLRLLVDGMAGRVPAWRLGGNSISPVLAAEAIASLREILDR